MFRTQRLLLKPTYKQRRLFSGSAGLSRYAWNWAVALNNRYYRWFGKRDGYKRLGAYKLMNRWNQVKNRKAKLAWVKKYSKLIPDSSFQKFNVAIKATFKNRQSGLNAGLPSFRRKGQNDSFNVVPSNCHPLTFYGKRVRIPRIGLVRIQTPLRWPGAKQVYGQVKYKAGRWWLTLSYELPEHPKMSENRPSCGIDLGCKTFATVASGGEIVEEMAPPKPYAKAKRRLGRLQRILDRRRVKGQEPSRRQIRARLRVAKLHERIQNVRNNFLHNLTAKLVGMYGTIVIEDLNVQAMSMGFVRKSIRDLGFGEFRRQLTYKCEAMGTKLVVADRFYPSSKTCNRCGFVRKDLKMSERILWCPCGEIVSRDHNAALNLEKLPARHGEDTRVESGVQAKPKGRAGATRRNASANKLPVKGI